MRVSASTLQNIISGSPCTAVALTGAGARPAQAVLAARAEKPEGLKQSFAAKMPKARSMAVETQGRTNNSVPRRPAGFPF